MGYKKVINERQEEMGEDNNSFGGYQPTEDNRQAGQQNPYAGAPQYGQNDQNYGQSDGEPYPGDCGNCDSGSVSAGSWTAVFPSAVTQHSVSGACGVEYEEKVGKYHEYEIYIDRNCGVGSCDICTEGTSICHI